MRRSPTEVVDLLSPKAAELLLQQSYFTQETLLKLLSQALDTLEEEDVILDPTQLEAVTRTFLIQGIALIQGLGGGRL